MDLIITDVRFAKVRPIHLTGTKLVLWVLGLSLGLMFLAVGLYNWVFLTAARQGWPVISEVVNLVAKDEFAQRDKYMKENLDVMAQKVGEIQAKLLQMEALVERLGAQAGIPVSEVKGMLTKVHAAGGPLVSPKDLSLAQTQAAIDSLHASTNGYFDLLYYTEAQLFERRMKGLTIPTQNPVLGADMSSPFGWRVDPFTGRYALHAGIDFQASIGTPILATAGGLVVTQEYHPSYGNMVEIDHGNNLVSRYAHARTVLVKKGDLVRRGQPIAEVGTTGRSTGPHLHYEVLLGGVPQDPRKFLDAGRNLAGQ